MMGPKELLAMGLKRNPEIANNPQKAAYIDAINSGDQERIKALAMNICNEFGVTPEQAQDATMRFFGIKR